MRQISTEQSPRYGIPLSQAMQHEDLIFASGNIGCVPTEGTIVPDEMGEALVSDDVAEQTAQTLENIEAVLNAAESSLDHVIKATLFLADTDDFPVINEVFEEYMSEPYPARSAFGVELAVAVDIEIEVIAEVPDSGASSGGP